MIKSRVPGATEVGVADAADASVWYSLRAYPGFRILFYSTLATNSAFWMWQLANGWLAFQLTGSEFFVGLTGFLGGIPLLLFALPIGVLIDRVDRRTILLAAQTIVALTSGSVATLLMLGLLQPWQLLIFTFVTGTAMPAVFMTRNALPANLVPPAALANAIALNAAGQNAPRVVGPTLAGTTLALLGTAGTFSVCAALQVLAVIITLRLPRIVPLTSAVRRTLWGSMTEGIGVIRRSQYLTGLMILAAVPTMLLMPYISLMPVFAEVLGIDALGLGLLMAANGLGAVLGSLLVAGWKRIADRPGVLLWTAGGFGASIFAFALTPHPLLAGGLIFLTGVVSAMYMALNNSAIQLNVDDSVRGRVLGVYLLTWGLFPIGVLPAGAAADTFTAPLAIAGMSVIAVTLITVVGIRFPSLRGRDAPVIHSQR